MSIKVTCSTTKLAADRHRLKLRQLILQPISKHANLLTQTSGRSRLSMSFCQHRHILPSIGKLIQLIDHLLQRRNKRLISSILHRHRHRSIIYILRSKTKMYKLLESLKPHLIETLFQEIFHRLNIVIGHALNFLDALSILHSKIAINIAQRLKLCRIHTFQLRQRQLAQCDKILHLHLHTVAN